MFFCRYWADSRLKAIYRTHELSGDYPVYAETVREGIQTAQTMYYYDKKLQVGRNSMFILKTLGLKSKIKRGWPAIQHTVDCEEPV